MGEVWALLPTARTRRRNRSSKGAGQVFIANWREAFIVGLRQRVKRRQSCASAQARELRQPLMPAHHPWPSKKSAARQRYHAAVVR
jgi:hypothetical protein